MWTFVQASKYNVETISIVVSFSDVIPSGDTITGTPTITVTLFTGFDTNPSGILYQGTTTLNNTVEQRFRLGIPGNIYQILYKVVTNHGAVFEKECTLAILPEEGVIFPEFFESWQSTQLYPYQFMESLQTTLTFQGGRFSINYSYSESIKTSLSFTAGTLRPVALPYSYGHEDLKTSMLWTAGDLHTVALPYSYGHEDIKTGLAWITGTLVVVALPYSYRFEAIQTSTTFVSGTLV